MRATLRSALPLALALAAPAAAQTVGGRVVDAATRQPLARVSVLVRVDSQLVRVETFRDGTFTVALPRAGRYRLELFPDAGPPFVTDSIDVGPDAFVQRELPITPRPDPVYLEPHVDKAVMFRAGNLGPRYPADLKRRAIDGEVVARYVVDTSGRMRPGSFETVWTSHPEFAAAVAASLRETRFVPAERDGRRVPQLVQHPFRFTVRKGMGQIIIVPPSGAGRP